MTKVKILYVEDEPFLAKIVKESLESREYQVKLVKDGAQVSSSFTSWKPDICVLDVMLPNKDGFTIAKEIRQFDATTPIIFLTAKDQTSDLINGFGSGGNDYIKKPFSMEELILRIQNLLNMVHGSSIMAQKQDNLSFASFKFHPTKLELQHKKQTRQLSHRECEILLMLIRNMNQTVARKSILLEVWGDDSYFNSRNLDVYITKLRDYLKIDPRIRIITLKGLGYRFVVE